MALIEINKNLSRAELRRFAGLWFPLFFIVVALMMFRKTHSTQSVAILLGIVLCISIAAYIFTSLARMIYLGWMYAAFPIGWTVSHILMALIYYAVLTPIALIMRMLGRNALSLQFEPRPSYWVEHRTGGDSDRYLSQY